MISDQEIKNSKETIEKVNIDGYKKIYNKYIEKQPKQNKVNKIYKLSFASAFIILLIIGLLISIPNISNTQAFHTYGDTYSSSEPSKPMREEEDALKVKIVVEDKNYKVDDIIEVIIYIGCKHNDVYKDDTIYLNVESGDLEIINDYPKQLNDFTTDNYPVTSKFNTLVYQKEIKIQLKNFKKAEGKLPVILITISAIEDMKKISDEYEKPTDNITNNIIKRECELKIYSSNGYMWVGKIGYGYPCEKGDLFLYEKNIISGEEVSKRYYNSLYEKRIVIYLSSYNNKEEYTFIYQSKNYQMIIKINGRTQLVDEDERLLKLYKDLMKENGYFRHEWMLEDYQVYAKNFIKYCLDNNYITQEQYDIEYNNIEQATNISSFNIGTSESKRSKIAAKYRKTIKNY